MTIGDTAHLSDQSDRWIQIRYGQMEYATKLMHAGEPGHLETSWTQTSTLTSTLKRSFERVDQNQKMTEIYLASRAATGDNAHHILHRHWIITV